ncbi:hypothetical protein CSUI_004915 [Cystoisospora suis]|uniref:Uncharacterized protein n=1 Tax=Cystoisospora suis TaxID=483139 RepID=A0A2C6KZG4_9APIC|nr:hypothetical protein CSUI_004915 [Cystoisospora suis]
MYVYVWMIERERECVKGMVRVVCCMYVVNDDFLQVCFSLSLLFLLLQLEGSFLS